MSLIGNSPRNRIHIIRGIRNLPHNRRTLSTRISRGTTANNTQQFKLSNSIIEQPGAQVPILSLNKINTFRSPRQSSRRSAGNGSLNSSLNSSGAINQSLGNYVTVIPRPPSKRRNEEMFQKRRKLVSWDELNFPVTPSYVLQNFKTIMTPYEHAEILDYREIYFIGHKAVKIKPGIGANFGFDDERGDYSLIPGDHIAFRYEIIKVLGKGSFGQVALCQDHKLKENIALKIIRNKKRFKYQATIEVKVLKTIKQGDEDDSANAVHMLDEFTFRKHQCLVFELLSMNLYELLKSNQFQGLSLNLIRRFAIQLLYCLRFTKSQRIIHCDLKPENILLKQANKSGIKVIDFGSACFEDERVYTYIQSRFYRAPEIMLGIPYSPAIDMWSFGCLIAELFTGIPLFPGENEQDQLIRIMELKGAPPDNILKQATRAKLFFTENRQPILVPNSRGKVRRPGAIVLQDVVPCKDENFLQFIYSKTYSECLEWDPDQRMKPEDALQHEWILEGLPRPPMRVKGASGRRRGPSNRRSANLPSLNASAPVNLSSYNQFLEM